MSAIPERKTSAGWCVPATDVLNIYTDESLLARDFFGASAADALLTVPAEYRQAVEVQVSLRASRTTYVGADQVALNQWVADPHEARLVVLAELRAFLDGGVR